MAWTCCRDGLVPPGVPGSRDVPEPYGYDPAKAKELIDGRGPVTLHLLYPVERFAQTIAESLAASYAKIGITLEPEGVEFYKLLKRLAAGKSQVFLLGLDRRLPVDGQLPLPALREWQLSIRSRTRSTRIPTWMRCSRRLGPPLSRRLACSSTQNAERKILADAPAVPLVVFADFRLMNNRVANVRFNSMVWADLWRAWVK